jgi:chemotaxis protein methyltransferase CheR
MTELAALVHRVTGIVVAGGDEHALGAALRRAAPGLDAAEFLARSAAAPEGRHLVERLVDELTVKETTFLRDRGQLDAIDWDGLLERAHRTGSSAIRVWSAACATGEEAYTLALLASQAFDTDEPPIDILGTDISLAALADAERGCYRERAMRHVDAPARQRFFTLNGHEHVVAEELRRHVHFQRHNLVLDPIPPLGEPPFDLIVCRNVLIYFDVPTIDRVRGAFAHAIRAGGTLVIGAADALGGSTVSVATLDVTRPPIPATPGTRELRRPLGRAADPSRNDLLRAALAAADAGRCDEARAYAATLLRRTPLDADAHFVHGVVELEDGSPHAAVASLRRALYVDPDFGVAAFALAFAHDTLGDRGAARRAYERALRTIDPTDDRHGALLEQIDLRNLTEACRLRLMADVTVRGNA